MNWIRRAGLLLPVLGSLILASSAMATSPVAMTFGPSWDGPANELQQVVDTYLGVPGAINDHADFVGGHLGDLDPWFWVGASVPALMVTEIAGNRDFNVLGWYRETGTKPAIDGVDDGVVFDGSGSSGASVLVMFPTGLTKFGFYLDTQHQVATPSGNLEQVFFTNRFYNDIGPGGFPATHAPFDGDVQAVVFDVSQWKGANTWLVCFEDRDEGLPLTPCCAGTDNDYNDLVFQVQALGATPAQQVSFGTLKARYR